MPNINQIGGIPFSNYLWNGPQVIGWFVFFATIIVVLVTYSVELIKIIAIKFKLNSVFISGIVLSTYTSFPELITSIYSGIIDRPNRAIHGSLLNFFNVTGANNLQMFLVTILGLFLFLITFKNYWQSKKSTNQTTTINHSQNHIPNYSFANQWHKIIRTNFVMWFITFIEYAIMIVAVSVPIVGQTLSYNGFSFLNLVFFVTWLGYLIYSYHSNQEAEDLYHPKLAKMWVWNINRWLVVLITTIVGGIFVFVAYLNSGIVDQFPQILSIPQNFAAGFILSVATSLPEIIVFGSLIYKQLYVSASGSLLGSSVFNLSTPFFVNVISNNSIYTASPTELTMNGEFQKTLPTLLFSIIIYVTVAISMHKKVVHKYFLTIPLLLLLFVGYIVGLILISQIQT